MTHLKHFALMSSLAFVALTSTLHAEDGAQTHPGPEQSPSYGQMVGRNLGYSGLLEQLNMNETFGKIQSRVGLQRANINYSNASSVTSGFENAMKHGVTPLDLMYNLPLGDGKSFIKLGVDGTFGRGSDDITQVDSNNYNGIIQYLYAPTPDTMFGVGYVQELYDVKLRHSDGTIKSSGKGIQGDYLHKFSDNWGLTARTQFLWGNDDTSVPVGGGSTLKIDQDYTRWYSQVDLVGTFSKESLSLVPEGWILRPHLTAAFQRTTFEETTDSFGSTVTGTVGKSDDYAMVAAKATLLSQEFRPFHFSPFLTLGIQHEVVNDLNLVVDDPTHLYAKIGASMNLGKGMRFDIGYGLVEGFNGQYRDQWVMAHVGVMF